MVVVGDGLLELRHHVRAESWLETITHAMSRVLGAVAKTALVTGRRSVSFLGLAKLPLSIDGTNRERRGTTLRRKSKKWEKFLLAGRFGLSGKSSLGLFSE